MPELTQSFVVPFPRAEVWRVFHQLDLVAGCMPGASLDKTDEAGRLRGEMRIKLGPIAAAFAGDADLQMDDDNWSGVIHGTGRDQKNNSRARADVRFGLAEQDPGTRVDVTVDFTLTGTLAQFSRGAIVQGIAQRITDDFARNLASAMQAQAEAVSLLPATPAEAPASPTPPGSGAPAVAPAHELRLLGVLWSLFTGWLYRQVGRLSPRHRGNQR
jgi:carbon monoxide dehydrogenase subunit G